MEKSSFESAMNLSETDLCLGLPGKRSAGEDCLDSTSSRSSTNSSSVSDEAPPPAKAQIVGWPPVRAYRKNSISSQKKSPASEILYVKVSMDGAPYLRKIDVKLYKSYSELLEALQKMFRITIGEYMEREGYDGSDYAPTYEDKEGDWMLVGDVPWEMFISSCKRLRIMKSSEAKGLGCLS